MTSADPPGAPRVSVAMVAFRHSAYVGQAIESVLAQDEEDWEIVLADDRSDDDTVAVARAYEERCRGPRGPRLRILPVERKYGRRPNFERALAACRGRYTAHLDADDYFTDPTKLRRQADALDADPSLSGVFTAWVETDEEGAPIGEPLRGFGRPAHRTRFGLADFASHCLTTSCVVMFRTRVFGEFPDWWRETEVGDWPLHVLNTLHGEYLYLDDVTAAHRNHGDGVWSAQSKHAQMLSAIRTYRDFLAHLPADRLAEVRPAIALEAWKRGKGFLRSGQPDTALELFAFCRELPMPPHRRLKLWHRERRARRAAREPG